MEEFPMKVWEHLRRNVGTTVRNRGLLLYYWCMAMMDNAMLESYGSFDYFPQASVKVQAFKPEDFKFGCSNLDRGAESWLPSVTAQNSHPRPLQVKFDVAILIQRGTGVHDGKGSAFAQILEFRGMRVNGMRIATETTQRTYFFKKRFFTFPRSHESRREVLGFLGWRYRHGFLLANRRDVTCLR